MAQLLMRRLVACCATLVVVSMAAAGPAAAHEKKKPATPGAAESAGLPIEDFAAYDGQDTCRTEEQPGVAAFRGLVLARFPETADSGILRGCHIGRRSEHKEGRAWDWHVDASDPADYARATQLINWLLAPDADGNANARARRLGIMYMIWDRQIWRSYQNPELGMADPYSGPNPHRDHIHFSFSEAGAAGLTSYWKLGNTAIRPTGTQTAIAVRYVDDSLRWYSAGEDGETTAKTVFGLRLDGNVPLVGDWDGDGVATEGLAWRDGRRLMWFLKPAKGKRPGVAFRFGVRGDVPVVGDWDGDGRTTVGVVRKDRDRLLWVLSNDNRTVAKRLYYGRVGATPVVGDWDADGRTSAGVVVTDRNNRLRWSLAANAVRRAPAIDLLKVAMDKAAKEKAAQKAAAKDKAAREKAAKEKAGAAKDTKTDGAAEAARQAKLADVADAARAAEAEQAAARAAAAEKAARVGRRLPASPGQAVAAKNAAATPPRPIPTLKTARRVWFGERGQRPVAGDWDGDGRTTFGTVEVQTDVLHWHVSNDAGLTNWMFDHGVPGDRPVVGDLDGLSAAELPEAKLVRRH